jgi:hypothetical protein
MGWHAKFEYGSYFQEFAPLNCNTVGGFRR